MSTGFTFFPTRAGFLKIAGDDRADFIQRQSTNDITKLEADTHLATVLTNPAARILDVLRVFDFETDAYGVVTLPGRGPTTANFLKRRIFFNDRVRLEDLSAETTVLELTGTEAAAGLARTGLDPAPAGSIRVVEIAGHPCRLLGLDDPLGRGWLLIIPAAGLDAVSTALQEAGAEELAADAHERLRIEAGIPGVEGELTEDYTPLEARLDAFISSTKGCYTGQEVIARQITYDKVTRRMAGILLEGPAAIGARIRAGDSPAGSLTSVVETPGSGWIGLGVLKRPYDQTGTEIRIEGDEEISGTISALPFSNS